MAGFTLPAPPPWSTEARCLQADPDTFFPEKGGSTRDAKRVCAACPVIYECLDYALDNRERFGVWAGHSERERRALLESTKSRRQSIAEFLRYMRGHADVGADAA